MTQWIKVTTSTGPVCYSVTSWSAVHFHSQHSGRVAARLACVAAWPMVGPYGSALQRGGSYNTYVAGVSLAQMGAAIDGAGTQAPALRPDRHVW